MWQYQWTGIHIIYGDLEAVRNTMEVPLVDINIPADIYLFKVNSRTPKKGEIYLKLTIKAPEQRHWRCSTVFIVNFEHISYLFLCFYGWLWTIVEILSSRKSSLMPLRFLDTISIVILWNFIAIWRYKSLHCVLLVALLLCYTLENSF